MVLSLERHIGFASAPVPGPTAPSPGASWRVHGRHDAPVGSPDAPGAFQAQAIVESFREEFEEYHSLVEGRVVAIHDLFNAIGTPRPPSPRPIPFALPSTLSGLENVQPRRFLSAVGEEISPVAVVTHPGVGSRDWGKGARWGASAGRAGYKRAVGG